MAESGLLDAAKTVTTIQTCFDKAALTLNTFQNSRVLPAGGAPEIGLSTARAFAEAGARVVIAGRDAPWLHRAATDVGHGAEARTFDLLELAPVRVNAVCPGVIDTSLYDAMEKDARAAMLSDAMLFLARNGFVTGSTPLIDGGGCIA